MIKIIRKVIKEPLVHFLILGGIIYIYYSSQATEDQTPTTQKIVLTKQEQDQIKLNYKEKHDKLPDDVMFNILADEALYDKVLLSEAYRLQLDKHDPVISQRLLKQMKFILLNSVKLKEPSEDELYKYYKKNIKEYSKIEKLSFYTILFKDPKDKEIDTIELMLNRFDINASYASYFGDKDSRLNHNPDVTYQDVKNLFGKYFANKLFVLQEGKWSKPIHSKYGSHIVYIVDKVVSTPYPFDDVQDRVYQDFLDQNRSNIIKKSYKDILKSYTLDIQR